ncbi:hypothetical protein GPECTOR_213g433 [Gonium pectorale]|uniref:Retroviral polymerase SH3-like domain-containing protein n=1 Tax=Gonium pectorale TaxID=33097 RepID=A0A150FWS5_GONPE|nr:hypothetical protein GPECTOR_213g433 [Gonium pectorale]|eukprot:KXZ42063.1 hypothetical protein GPECTOR_213g433 [Gonium pectorale]
MLLGSGLEPRYWRLATEAANAVRLRSPVRGLAVTPHKLFWGVRPSAVPMRVFGCTAYVRKPDHTRSHKFATVADKGRFVGWEPDGNYRVLVNGKLVISRDVAIDETGPWQPTPLAACPDSDSDEDCPPV